MPPIKAIAKYNGLNRLFLAHAMTVPKIIGIMVPVRKGALNSVNQTFSLFISRLAFFRLKLEIKVFPEFSLNTLLISNKILSARVKNRKNFGRFCFVEVLFGLVFG